MAGGQRQRDEIDPVDEEPSEIVEQREIEGAPAIGERNPDTTRLFLELAMDRARGVRDTADAINSKVSWVFAYLGVLLVAMAQGISGTGGHTALQWVATATVVIIVVNAGVTAWAALKMEPLHGLGDHGWPSETEARRPSADVAYDMASTILDEAKNDRSPTGAISSMKRRLRYLQWATAASTAAVCVFFVVKIWST